MRSQPPLSRLVLTALLGPNFAVAVAAPRLVNEELFPDERRHVAHAVEKRQAEFGTARVCARHALDQLGIPSCSLVPYPDRSPRWPNGIIGSISHTEGCCAVSVTRAAHIVGFGLDVEMDTPLPPELEPMICTASERVWLSLQPPENRGSLGKLFFSAKEAFYKCQYRTTQTLIDFQDVELTVDLVRGAFSIAGIGHQGPCWDRIWRTTGKFRLSGGMIVTTAILTSNDGLL